MSVPLVEVLTFEGCPHAERALELVRRIVAEGHMVVDVRRIDVPDAESARGHCFLGSPTIRVNGVDIDPEADGRDEWALSCRIYRTEQGVRGEPDERWLRDALRDVA